MATFGLECRKKHFLLRDNLVVINNGSFGAIPRVVLAAQQKLQENVEECPDVWFRYNCNAKIQDSLQQLAVHVNCDPRDLVLVENATTGVYTTLCSQELGEGRGVLITNLTYPAIANQAKHLCEKTGATLHILDIQFPITSVETVVGLYRNYLSSHSDICVSVVDHITSPSTVLLPVKEIVRVCHEGGVRVVLDGAHGPGHLTLNLQELGADYYTGNLHKWMFCPRGCALLYVRRELQESVRPLVASHLFFQDFRTRFLAQQTRDNSSYCCVPAALEFIASLGGKEVIHAYNTELVEWAADMLSERWNQPKLPVPTDMLVPFMRAVRLPESLQGSQTFEYTRALIQKFTDQGVNVAVDIIGGEVWTRISAHVYNFREEYERFAQVVEEMTAVKTS